MSEQSSDRAPARGVKLDRLVLGLIVAGASLWLSVVSIMSLAIWPWGVLILIPIGIGCYVLGAVIAQRLANREDDYYARKIDR